MLTAAIALIWANSPAADSYHHLWHMPLSIGLGDMQISQSLHFWINDGLMTIFFLVVGLEIRREIHEGALATLQLASLPMVAAFGGVAVPALLYLLINHDPVLHSGWAVPTATDIAFAVGVLALLGKSIPPSVRVFLLALAIIDDIVAVLIIAVFYSGGLEPIGFLIAGAGILLVLVFQQLGIGSAYAYVLPGAVLWFGLLKTGAHPTLAGVVLGLMTPVFSRPDTERPLERAMRALNELAQRVNGGGTDVHAPVKELAIAQRELLPPVLRVQSALHPWVAYGIMPLFALANAGVSLGGVDLSHSASLSVMFGVLFALVIGKPIGIMLTTWVMVKTGLCKLPDGMNWGWVTLVGFLAGIGFTMSIFIAQLAFADAELLSAAKLGVLCASAVAAVLGLIVGNIVVRRARAKHGL
jgi:NhaA family Na+:H+ antiporter